jgi:prophage DNA circulation protein
MAYFDTLRPVSFGGIQFPTQQVRVQGGVRDHVHEYPHQPGGAPEKLGRKLYEINITADFQAALTNPSYRDLHARLGQLRSMFETETSASLVLPTIGTITAYAVNWSQTMEAKNRSGERAELMFREDQSAAFLTSTILQESAGKMGDRLTDWNVQIGTLKPRPPSIFDRISAAANSVLAIKDQVDLYGELVEAKILGLLELIREADKDVRELNEPQAYRICDALLALWDSANQLHQDIVDRGVKLVSYVVPVQMNVAQISGAVFGGDSSRGGDLMGLNGFPDPFSVVAGTVVRYYANAA